MKQDGFRWRAFIFALPLAAVLMGAVTVYLTVRYPDSEVKADAAPLSKTSWREDS